MEILSPNGFIIVASPPAIFHFQGHALLNEALSLENTLSLKEWWLCC
jgi:hypothetical protein